MAAYVRMHLLSLQGMVQEKVEMDVGGKGLRLDKLLLRLDKKRFLEKGFFRSVVKGRQGVSLLLNGERLDFEEDKKVYIQDGDELAILSPISGG